MTAKEMADQVSKSSSAYVTYGDGDLGKPVAREDAVADILAMDDDSIGTGTWYECDEHGNVI